MLASAGEQLDRVQGPALLLWATGDPYIPTGFGRAYADALGGPVELELVDGGHWPWLDRPELVQRTVSFLARPLG